MIWETVRLAFTAIIRNKLRSFLTVLGVVIGVAAVIAMVTIGQGSSAQVEASVEALGTNVLIVRPGTRSGVLNAISVFLSGSRHRLRLSMRSG